MMTCEGDTPSLKRFRTLTLVSPPGHSQILFHSRGEKPIFPWLWDKIWEWPRDEATLTPTAGFCLVGKAHNQAVLELSRDYRCTNASELISWHKTQQESIWVAVHRLCTHSYWNPWDSPSWGDRVTVIGLTNSLSTSNFSQMVKNMHVFLIKAANTITCFIFVVKKFRTKKTYEKILRKYNFTMRIFPHWLAPCYTQAFPQLLLPMYPCIRGSL